MRIAIPVTAGKLSPHFGHCEEFALIDVDQEKGLILGRETLPAPEHQPGLLPQWLADQGASLIIASGIGGRAIDLFNAHQIDVLAGAPIEDPDYLTVTFLNGSLSAGMNVCDHHGHEGCGQ